MFMGIKRPSTNTNCSLDKTGEGNVVLDLAISAQKYSKIYTQQKKNSRNPRQCFSKLSSFFYRVLTSFFTCLCAKIRPSTKTKKCSWDKTGEGNVRGGVNKNA